MRIVTKDQYREFEKVFINSENYNTRIKAHIPILFEKHLTVNTIGHIYEKSETEVYVYLKYIDLFGLNEYFEISYDEAIERIEEEEYRLEQIRLKNRKVRKSIFYYLVLPLKLVFAFLTRISKMTLVLSAYLLSSLSSKSLNKEEVNNYANLEKGSSNNIIIQIGTYNEINNNIDTTHLVTESEDEMANKIKELIESNNLYNFGNDRANKLFVEAQKISNDESITEYERNRQVKYYALLIVGIILYSSTFKGGISSVSVFGVVIAVSVRACLPSVNDSEKNIVPPDPIPSVIKIDSLNTNIDTAINTLPIEKPIVKVEEYIEEVPNWFDYDANCLALSAIGKRQRDFIRNRDKVNHYAQEYYINSSDFKYYLHVVAYNSIREAAFQMEFVRNNTSFRPKILEVSKNSGQVLYAVVIGQFEGDEIEQTCEMVDEWSLECITGNNEIGYIFNGI